MSNDVAIVGSNPFGVMTDASAQLFSTISTATDEGREQIFAALAAAEPLADHLDEVIELRHVVAQMVELADAVTGEMGEHVRTILVTEDGACYSAVSSQITRTLGLLFGLYGRPETWDAPVPVVVRRQRSKNGFFFFNLLPARFASQVK